MKITTITFVAGAAIASIATGDTVAPGDVKFDDYGAVAASLTGVAGDPANGRKVCLLYTSPSPRDLSTSRMPSSA